MILLILPSSSAENIQAPSVPPLHIPRGYSEFLQMPHFSTENMLSGLSAPESGIFPPDDPESLKHFLPDAGKDMCSREPNNTFLLLDGIYVLLPRRHLSFSENY